MIEETLQKAAQGDCGAAFEEPPLMLLLALRDNNYPEWMRVRAQIKNANRDVSVLKLDKAIAHLGRKQREIQTWPENQADNRPWKQDNFKALGS